MRVTADPTTARSARLVVADALAAEGLVCETARLLVSELASNVILHARTPFHLVVEIKGSRIRVELHDGMGATEAFRDLIHNHPRQVATTAGSGRGLLLMSTTAASFGLIDKGAEGKMVWFEAETQPA